jgi:DNA primase
MPGIDFAELRSRIGIAQAPELAGFEASESSGDQIRGPCPIHGSTSPGSRSFSANLRKHTFRCFKCGQSGNQLDLWVCISKLPLHDAAIDLRRKAGVEVPYVAKKAKA